MQFKLTSQSNFEKGFTITLIDKITVGHFSFTQSEEGPAHSVRVIDNMRGKGYGKLLLLKAIQTAEEYNLGFQCDQRGLTKDQHHVYDSLEKKGLIEALGLGIYKITNAGEEYLERSLHKEREHQQPL